MTYVCLSFELHIHTYPYRRMYSVLIIITLADLQLVQSEITESSPEPLQAVKQLAVYLKDESQRQDTLEQISSWLADPSYANNSTVLTIIGLIYALEGNYVEALRACHSGTSLEMYVVVVYPSRTNTKYFLYYYQLLNNTPSRLS